MPDPYHLPDISSYAAPVYVFFILAEIFLINAHKVRGDYEAKDAAASISMGLGNVVFGALFATSVYAFFYTVLLWFYQFRLIDMPFTFWALALCFIVDDFFYYWSHRLQHTIRWGWANHVVHHSSQHYNLSTALRQPWFSFLTGSFVLGIPMVLIGFHPAWIAFVGSLNLFYQFFIHTEAVRRMHPWIEAIFNTPSHHRVHHGRNPRYLDANYGGLLIIWDKIFGTFVPEDDAQPVRYGIVKNIGTFNPLKVAIHEYVSILKDITQPQLTIKQRLAYLFAPPGWSHDGSRSTSRNIKLDYLRHHPHMKGTPGLLVRPADEERPAETPVEPAE